MVSIRCSFFPSSFQNTKQPRSVLCTPASGHQSVELLHHRASHRLWHSHARRLVHHHDEVLVMEARFDARSELVCRHLSAKEIEYARTGRSAEHSVTHLAKIDPRRLREMRRFRASLDGGDHHQLVAGLGHLPGPGIANADDCFSEAGEHWIESFC